MFRKGDENMKEVSTNELNIQYKKISFEKMDQMIKEENINDYYILDVRTKEENEEKKIPNSLLIPDYEIEKILDEIPDKEKYIFVYCRSGNRSKTAVLKINNMGYKNVYDVGGIIDYRGEVITSK
jgi:rhodanese-related sulfurtransferase